MATGIIAAVRPTKVKLLTLGLFRKFTLSPLTIAY
jgi:hypothetical protein